MCTTHATAVLVRLHAWFTLVEADNHFKAISHHIGHTHSLLESQYQVIMLASRLASAGLLIARRSISTSATTTNYRKPPIPYDCLSICGKRAHDIIHAAATCAAQKPSANLTHAPHTTAPLHRGYHPSPYEIHHHQPAATARTRQRARRPQAARAQHRLS